MMSEKMKKGETQFQMLKFLKLIIAPLLFLGGVDFAKRKTTCPANGGRLVKSINKFGLRN